MSQNLSTDHSRAVLDGEHSEGMGFVPISSRADRLRSFDPAAFGEPTGSEEEWRFTRLKDLSPTFEDAPSDEDALDVVLDRAGTEDLPGLAPGQAPRGDALIPGDLPAALGSKHTESAHHVRLADGQVLAEPIRVTLTAKDGKRSHSHIVIEAGRDSQGLVLLEHAGTGVHNGNVEIIVGENANLTVVSLQLWGDDAVHAGQHEAKLGAHATYRHINVTLGGKAVRLTNNVQYAGERGDAELLGLYFVDNGQHLEHQTYINHTAPNCKSNVTYKGALQGESAHSVWIGDVLIGVAAEGTDTYELNRNLVLTEGARADSVPNLEIETGEIEGAGHASATGRFDDEQLFYLRSRGVPEDVARRLVVRGFFAELITQIGIPEIQDRLMAMIEEELDQTMKVVE